MTASAEAVLDLVAHRLRADPDAVLPTLRLLADTELAPVGDRRAVEVGRAVNARRLAERRQAFQAGALSTAQVTRILGVSRQALSSRVKNGRLLALELANTLWFPDWQLGPDGLVSGVDRVVPELLAAGRGVLAADALMRHPLVEEGGRSPAQLLALGRLEPALHYVRTAGADL